MQLTDPTTFTEWVQPHSIEWYKQLSDIQGKYIYSWNPTLTEPNGESIFDKEVTKITVGRKVLDVRCGHGELTNECGSVAKEIIGFDVTEKFLQVRLKDKKPNVSFVLGNIKNGLPFEMDEFDCSYIRKGPTSAYPYLKKVIKSGGKIIGLHPGDETNKELPLLFPNLFDSSIGTPILNLINHRIDISKFSHSKIEAINSTEYIHSPLDVLKLRCFGQHPSIYETLKEKNLYEVSKISSKMPQKMAYL